MSPLSLEIFQRALCLNTVLYVSHRGVTRG